MVSRRRFLAGAGGALVLGWSPLRRTWVTRAEAGEPFDSLPPLDGVVHTDGETLEAFSEDFGGIVSRRPVAVLAPGSVEDIVNVIRFARKHRIVVATNGQAGTDDQRESHSQFGQAQAPGGLVIDARPLATIHGIDGDARIADVGAGVRWAELFGAAEAFGLAPAVMNDFMHLSVGGTLSLGGVGGHTAKRGTQADNVVELEVVTGAGDRVICSRQSHRQLFHGVLAGAGQIAIIVRARVRLIRAHARALVFNLFYNDVTTYVEDQTLLLDDGRFDYQEGQIVRRPDDSGWRFMIEVVKYFDPPGAPDPAALLAGLRDDRDEAEIFDLEYREWQFRVDPLVIILKALGLWDTPHPFMDLFLPGSRAAALVGDLVAGLAPDDVGGPILFHPLPSAVVKVPLFRLPREPIAFQLSLLRLPGPDPDLVARLLEDNRALYDTVASAGGTRYLAGAIPRFTRQDWRRHFQPRWGVLSRAKRRFDPDNILGPGWGIFE